MAEEPQVIYVLRIIFEVIWVLLRLNLEIIKSLFRVVVPQDRKDVKGDIVLVTGAGHGMGREIATRFGKLGAKVVCVDINSKGNEETISLIKKNKGDAYAYICDVTDRSAVMQLAEKVEKDVGQVDILVNNAGIMPCKPVLKQTEKEIRATMEINVNGNLWMIQAFLPAMLDRNSGHIVAMSSMAGKMGLRNLVPYCGSKYAVRGIMESLAVELHEDPRNTNGIKFTTICPYIVNTGLCHNPRIRFEAVMKTVDPGDAADQIVDAIFNLLSPSAGRILTDFIGTGLDPHDN
ncbi:hypothetical protein HW555_011987 [Spodoptera exigua]|uniref:Short-chain dehydrogenase/reductase 3 n=1 Tax=Spodoptera exigua TaxID=7107 RepID=A0A835G5X8_SPOEX|nr:hypothetical protein HW555_011987 [Spodoptera exigua]